MSSLIGGITYPANDRYVASNGSDSNQGTIISPWQTIAKVNASNTSGKTIYFRGGDRFSDAALSLHSSTNYTSYGTGRAVISGGVQVSTWTQTDVGNNIWRASLASANPRVIWVNGTRVVRARTAAGLPSGSTSATTTYSTASSSDPGYMSAWGNQSDIEFGYFWEWRHAIAQVQSVSGNTITMNTTSFPIMNAMLVATPSMSRLPDYIENAYEILAANATAGTFYYDRTASYLYLIPPAGVSNPNSATVIAPLIETIASATGVSNVTVANIEFSYTTSTYVTTNGLPDVQANVPLTSTSTVANAPTSILPPAVLVTGGSNVVFTRCVFGHLGNAGLGFLSTSTDSGAFGCIVYDTSASGIQVGNTGQYLGSCPVRPTISNCFVGKFGLEFLGAVGITHIWATESLLTHNEVYIGPYSGISEGWGWADEPTPNGNSDNVVSYNYVHECVRNRNDGGGIYLNSHNPDALIHNNYVCDSGLTSWAGPNILNTDGIFTDNGSQGLTVYENVLAAVTNRAFFANDNIDDNVFHDNTSDAGTYLELAGPNTIAPNTYDTLNIVSTAAARALGLAMGVGLTASYADVKAEADILIN